MLTIITCDEIVKILFKDSKLESLANDTKLARRRLGPRRAKLLRRRLDDLEDAETLEVIRFLLGRCHELKGDLAGKLSIDLDHPSRLLFRPAHNPIPQKPDGGLDWSRVTAIEVTEIRDTHAG